MESKTLLGSGILNWPSFERQTDRYGSVNLNLPGDVLIKLPQDLAGRYGKLTAEIKEVRRSGHIGDIFRGLYPSQPAVGDTLILGEGTLFFDVYETVGLKPSDGRDSDWLNPEVLYRLHTQTIDLYFVEEALQ